MYYYNARYYDAAIGRFISADTIVPDFANPQSLNRYSYCYNNPLVYIDPTGHWGWSNIKKWSGNRANDVRKAAKVAATVVTDNIDTIQMAIDVAGLIPVVGEAFDAANAAIYTARGDYVSAGLSLAACIPVAGSAATAAKLAKNTVKAVDKAQALRKVTKAVDASNGIRALSTREARLYYNSKLPAIDRAIARWRSQGLSSREIAERASSLRNTLKTRTRSLMADQATAQSLPQARPFQYYVDKYSAQGLTGDALYERIISGTLTPNPAVNASFGMP